jgi:hypothetical protein
MEKKMQLQFNTTQVSNLLVEIFIPNIETQKCLAVLGKGIPKVDFISPLLSAPHGIKLIYGDGDYC